MGGEAGIAPGRVGRGWAEGARLEGAWLGELSPLVLAGSPLIHSHTMTSELGAGAEFIGMQQN